MENYTPWTGWAAGPAVAPFARSAPAVPDAAADAAADAWSTYAAADAWSTYAAAAADAWSTVGHSTNAADDWSTTYAAADAWSTVGQPTYAAAAADAWSTWCVRLAVRHGAQSEDYCAFGFGDPPGEEPGEEGCVGGRLLCFWI